jgi:inhibitor of KinA
MRIFPLGESAVTVEFGNQISLDLNRKALDLAEHFQKEPFQGFIESVPAYASASVFYDPLIVGKSFPEFPTAFDAVRLLAESALSIAGQNTGRKNRTVEVPIIINDETAPDLDRVSEFGGIPSDEVISIFLDRTYRVFMLGFLPGFAYMGEVDERIAAPRKQTPRVRVPKGSVGIAGRQTGIYPLESPGGWQLLGRTEMQMFDPADVSPCALEPGDTVKFIRT